ncbi:di-heme oxidoredictase family protein [Duganella sp. Root1480D1]|uniref:di-heme oxidoredictase family protein n=1 Tax=Duganella sp. Root1480D1 TaxID=1736471 RepID=UPI00070EF892|nr:di-heme oxidoredictase family protein [Duganella sp. Root1480D1]KQZ28076.1 thiol oxidoreductase [Duganella sp. Root1480D1]
MLTRHRITQGLPLALAALLAACGGGNGSDSSAAGTVLKAEGATQTTETSLTPTAAIASAFERGDLSAAAAIDHNDGTRWSSGFTDDQYLTLDFGKTVAINRVRIAWENAHATEYLLQVSDDNAGWTTIKSVQNSQGGTEDWSGLAGQGRYLRMKGIKRSSQYGYSIFEIQAFSGTPASPTPTPQPDPQPGDPSAPGKVVKPVTATSSGVENAGLSASAAIDGQANTRWASSKEDGAWIQFDFGARTAIGYMKLTWENAYAKQYSLLVSDDGNNWSQLRLVTNGQGGTEEFFNLGANARYIRMQGIARATQYGYSLFEVEFKSPGSDNTLQPGATSALRFPSGGDAIVPLPGAATPLETLQFTLADGTLVTRFGARGFARHGRERGEDWNEIGYGPNETVDPATGLPVDKGPGNYLTFVPQYFKNRTWGVEIVDNSRVPGVTKPTLAVNQYTTVDFLSGGIAFFRAIDRPGVTGYGWMAPGELVDNNVKVCKPSAYPAAGQLAAPGGINGACTLLVKQYPGMNGLDANGFPNGTSIPARPLVVGDVIEVSPSMFSTTESMLGKGDSGGIRYYSAEWTYVVGTGLRPWYGVQPRLNSVPLPAETLSGGLGSVSYNYSDNGLFMFQQPQNNAGMQNMQRFVEGRRLIHTNFTTGDHNEAGNDRYTPAVGLQGQRFNQSACIGCHVNNGRSPAPIAVNQKLDTMSVRVAVAGADGQQMPHPLYGTAVQMNAVSSSGAPQNWGTGVRVAGFETRSVNLADGTAVELRKPTIAYEGPAPEIASLRAAQPMIGTGLLEAVPEADILARVRNVPDADGVKGTANYVYDPDTGAVRLGRFGWKASKATLRHQAAAALLQDMAVTSPVYPNRSCGSDPAGCKSAAAQRGVSEPELQLIAQYLALIAVPAQRSLPSGFPKGVAPLDEHRVDAQQVSAGSRLFQAMRCSACHTVEMRTGPGHLLAELRNQVIRPYTDLLLHDMGTGLADSLVEGQAKGGMWRTAPLWGIGYTDKVMGNGGKAGYLHDGRARTLTEAIMWHGGEGEVSRQRFAALQRSDREALLAFLKSL